MPFDCSAIPGAEGVRAVDRNSFILTLNNDSNSSVYPKWFINIK